MRLKAPIFSWAQKVLYSVFVATCRVRLLFQCNGGRRFLIIRYSKLLISTAMFSYLLRSLPVCFKFVAHCGNRVNALPYSRLTTILDGQHACIFPASVHLLQCPYRLQTQTYITSIKFIHFVLMKTRAPN